MRVGLINTNRLQPPVAPIGLDYIAEAIVKGYRGAFWDILRTYSGRNIGES